MIDQSLLKSNFIGRDGFRWWIGQIPPLSSMGKQVEGGGWGNRFKVRIIGYHPYSAAELPDEDLPWAQCLIPTTAGSGAANVSTGVQLQQGDVVLGFFLDGDNAQIPVILATFGRSDSVPSTDYVGPFQAFTGYSNLVKKNPKTTPSENNQVTENSNRSPQSLTPEQAQQLSQKVGEQVVAESEAIGDKIPLANTVKNTQIDKIKSRIQNLLKKIKKLQGDIEKIRKEIDKAVNTIVTYCNDFIGGMFDFLINGDEDKGGNFPGLKGLLKKGLKALYDLVFAQVFAATANPAAAHLAGVAAQQAMVLPVKALEEAFGCVMGASIDGLKGIVSEILNSVVDNVDRFVSCAADQFAGTLLNSIVGVLENLMSGPLDGVEKLLQFFENFNLGNVLREGIGMFSEFGVGFGCNQDMSNFKGLVNEWVVGSGPSGSVSTLASSMVNTYQSVQNIANIVNSGVNIASVQECFTDALQFASPPIINIFGGRGSGCTAIPIFGNLVTNSDGQTTASVIGVQITNPGSGYTFPPFIEIIDDNDQGYGAVARSIINANGEVESIYIVSEGENYSVGNISEYSVLKVLVEDGGTGYKDAEVTDNFGNTYNHQVVNERIYQVTPLNNVVKELPILTVKSNTGTGAILRPLLGAPNFTIPTEDIQTVVDCVI
jgi:outer membrane murein-binding lipoprotein Lpp